MGGQRSRPSFLRLLLIPLLAATMSQLWAFPFSASLDLDITPRTTVLSTGIAADLKVNVKESVNKLTFWEIRNPDLLYMMIRLKACV